LTGEVKVGGKTGTRSGNVPRALFLGTFHDDRSFFFWYFFVSQDNGSVLRTYLHAVICSGGVVQRVKLRVGQLLENGVHRSGGVNVAKEEMGRPNGGKPPKEEPLLVPKRSPCRSRKGLVGSDEG